MASALIVDDDPKIAALIEAIMRSRGISTRVAHSGAEGLDLVDAMQPDYVFLDIMMPGMDGATVLAELRRRPALNRTRIVMVTAKNFPRDAIEAHRVGADAYVTKPFTMAELLAAAGLQ